MLIDARDVSNWEIRTDDSISEMDNISLYVSCSDISINSSEKQKEFISELFIIQTRMRKNVWSQIQPVPF